MHERYVRRKHPLIEPPVLAAKKRPGVGGELQIESEARRKHVPRVQIAESLDLAPGLDAGGIVGGHILADRFVVVVAHAHVQRQAVFDLERVLGEHPDVSE